MQTIFCGIDIGTTNTKTVLISSEGLLLDSAVFPAPDSNVPETLSNRFEACLDYFKFRGHFCGQDIVCSITAQGGTFILLDRDLRPVSDIYNWTALADETIVARMRKLVDPLWFYRTTGWDLHAWLAAAKLKELADKGLVPAEAASIASVPDFIVAQLSGEFVADITTAQILGLVDFKEKSWCHRILDLLAFPADSLPRIETYPRVIAERVPSPWGRLTFVTGSHDQYAAMNAANLRKDKDLMLATGTAWVINARTSVPVFDYRDFLIHPGSDFADGCFGNIIALGAIGGGFDRLLHALDVEHERLFAIEDSFSEMSLPDEPLHFDVLEEYTGDLTNPELTIRRYMEWAAARVAYALGQFAFTARTEKIVMTGGAVNSAFWPKVIAEICSMAVEAVDFPQFTAYGAALFAKQASGAGNVPITPPLDRRSKLYEPVKRSGYRRWYENCQKQVFSDYLCSGKVRRTV